MTGRFGAQLRQRREEQGIDLIAIAAQTKIKMSLLEALERDDVSHWPSGIFRRAYIRTYAQAIGLDPDAVLREFLEAYPEPAEVVSTEAIASAVESRVHTGPPTRLRYIVGSAFNSLTRFRRPQVEESQPVFQQPRAERPAVAEATPAVEPQPRSDLRSTSEPMDLGEALMTEPLVDRADEHTAAAAAVGGLDEETTSYVEPERTVEEEPEAAEIEEEPQALMLEEPSAPVAEDRGADFTALAQVCTRFGQVADAADVEPLLGDAARVLDAPGLILWLWDPSVDGLRAALAHGYSDRVLAHLPVVGREADNATAAAFRRGQACSTRGDQHTNSAVVVPLLTAGGCAGVLAVELAPGREQDPSVQTAATIIAAMLAQLATAPASSSADPDEYQPSFEEVPRMEAPVRQSAGRR